MSDAIDSSPITVYMIFTDLFVVKMQFFNLQSVIYRLSCIWVMLTQQKYVNRFRKRLYLTWSQCWFHCFTWLELRSSTHPFTQPTSYHMIWCESRLDVNLYCCPAHEDLSGACLLWVPVLFLKLNPIMCFNLIEEICLLVRTGVFLSETWQIQRAVWSLCEASDPCMVLLIRPNCPGF